MVMTDVGSIILTLCYYKPKLQHWWIQLLLPWAILIESTSTTSCLTLPFIHICISATAW